MGIFSLFGKKDQQKTSSSADKDASRKKTDEASLPQPKSTNSHNDSSTIARQIAGTGPGNAGNNLQAEKRKAAKETAQKIDDIESQMYKEFDKSITKTTTTITTTTTTKTTKTTKPDLPSSDVTTEFLLNSEDLDGHVILPAAVEATPVIEEAAILYANEQFEMVEQVLQSEIQGDAVNIVWQMLFDLYQVTEQKVKFESLSFIYVNKFETSPPAWMEPTASTAETSHSWHASQLSFHASQPSTAKTIPAVPFHGKLDGNIAKQLERVQNLAANHRTLRLEFARVTEVDPGGCDILLNGLKKLQKSGNDLILVGALELVTKIRSILETGRREAEAAWLLLLEVLRLLNLEKEFEEASMDYCVTFEVSPPAFVPPKNKVMTAVEEAVAHKLDKPDSDPECFMMPAIVAGRTDQLIRAIDEYAAAHTPAVLDCSHLKRVDFSAAGQLLSGLAPVVAKGVTIEFHHVNYLVAALFNVMGLKDLVRVLPRKG